MKNILKPSGEWAIGLNLKVFLRFFLSLSYELDSIITV